MTLGVPRTVVSHTLFINTLFLPYRSREEGLCSLGTSPFPKRPRYRPGGTKRSLSPRSGGGGCRPGGPPVTETLVEGPQGPGGVDG